MNTMILKDIGHTINVLFNITDTHDDKEMGEMFLDSAAYLLNACDWEPASHIAYQRKPLADGNVQLIMLSLINIVEHLTHTKPITIHDGTQSCTIQVFDPCVKDLVDEPWLKRTFELYHGRIAFVYGYSNNPTDDPRLLDTILKAIQGIPAFTPVNWKCKDGNEEDDQLALDMGIKTWEKHGFRNITKLYGEPRPVVMYRPNGEMGTNWYLPTKTN